MKQKLLRYTLLLIIYVLAYIYFAVFNWKVFLVNLNIDLGFGVVSFPPFVVFFLLGFIMIGFLSWRMYMAQLQRRIFELEQGVELGKMRDKLLTNKIKQLLSEEQNMELLRETMGIKELRQKQEELEKMIQQLGAAQPPTDK